MKKMTNMLQKWRTYDAEGCATIDIFAKLMQLQINFVYLIIYHIP